MVCAFDSPPDATKIRPDEDNVSSNDTKEIKTEEEVLEILMDVPSSTNFVDITSNILTQLGIMDNSESIEKGAIKTYVAAMEG